MLLIDLTKHLSAPQSIVDDTREESCEAGLASLHALSTLTDRVPARTPSTSKTLL
jgi:hypothetical protein